MIKKIPERKKGKRSSSKLKRRIVINSEEWTWQYNKCDVIIRDPDGKKTTVRDYVLLDMSNYDVERAYYKGYLHITPSKVKNYIERKLK